MLSGEDEESGASMERPGPKSYSKLETWDFETEEELQVRTAF